jgi:hypothetical protein
MGAAQVEAEVRQETQEILIQAAVAVLALIVEAHGAMVQRRLWCCHHQNPKYA